MTDAETDSDDNGDFIAAANNSASEIIAANTSNYVYIRSKEHSWLPGRLLETDEQTSLVSIPRFKDEQQIVQTNGNGASVIKRFEKITVHMKDYPSRALPLQNVDEKGNLTVVPDMVDLPFLHEAAILFNLKARHLQSLPYTRTGDIVLAVNPYVWLNDLYSATVQSEYSHALVWNPPPNVDARQTLEPHIYEASALAYRGLAVDGEDQSILVSGESGAGKTESVKICLNHIASVQQGRNNSNAATTATESLIVKRVLDSNPLLEAFGNAKTVRNDNSSRFGKYIRLQFDQRHQQGSASTAAGVPPCLLAGSKCEVYLLEKSRVVTHSELERTYHIFYQLLAVPDSVKMQYWEGLVDTDNESFSYVGFTETDTIEGETDDVRFEQTIEALKLVGITDDKLRGLMRAICIVMQLGNLIFEADSDNVDRTEITSEEEFVALAGLMEVPAHELLPALTIRTMRARHEVFKVPLNEVQAKDSCDAFAKEIYAKTFLWLVRAINAATCAELNYECEGKKKQRQQHYGVIGLLDIFGFESFETNRFEQLCINYANEKLQQKFTQDIFRSVQAEYEIEGIELEEITYDDNTDVLDLVEGRMGLLAFLNEECVRPGGNDVGFVSKVEAMNKDNPCFLRENHFENNVFGVKHFAGPVYYDATGFVNKNMDTLPSDLTDCAKKSSNQILANELECESMMHAPSVKKPRKLPPKPKGAAAKKQPPPSKKGSNLIGDTVWTKFKGQLTSLMTSLNATQTRYIRCIKPNTFKEPLIMQHQSTVEQLRCAGVVAAVTISRSAFPNRLDHQVVIDRFRSIWGQGENRAAERAVRDMEDPEEISRTMVDCLLTHGLKPLENQVDDNTTIKAFVIGTTRAYFRSGALEYLEAIRVKKLGGWTVIIQRAARRFVYFRRYRKIQNGSRKLQAQTRMRTQRSNYLQWRAAAIASQCWYRCAKARIKLRKLNRDQKATLIQTRWRILVSERNFKQSRSAAVAIQTMARGALQIPKYRQALHDKKEEAKLENQVVALQRKLEEAERLRIDAEKAAEEKARLAVQEYQDTEEKKEALSVATPDPTVPSGIAEIELQEGMPSPGQLSAQQQTLMDESGKMLEYLRKEVFKLRSQNAQMRTDFDLLKDNNQRLMDANASAGASFAALNQHAKQLTRTNDKLAADMLSFKGQVQKLSVTQVELKEELKMKQATYTAEVHSRLQFQKALGKIVDVAQERCRDERLVEDILGIADECESEYMSDDPGGPLAVGGAAFTPAATPNKGRKGTPDTGLMSSIRNLWS